MKEIIAPVRKTNSIKREMPITYGPIKTKVVVFFCGST